MTGQFTKKILLRPWQTRTHCCGHIVSDEFFWRAQMLGTQNECCVSVLRKLGNICCGHKMFLNKIRNIFCVCNKYCVREQTGKHLCRQQCVRNNVSSFAMAFKLITLIEKWSFYTGWMGADDRTKHKMHLCCEYMENVNKNVKEATATNQLCLANLTTFLNTVVSKVPRGITAPWVTVIIKKRPSIYHLFVKCWLSIRIYSNSIKLPRFQKTLHKWAKYHASLVFIL